MVVARSLEELEFDKKSIITVGTFDGVHLGHQEIIKILNSVKQNKGLRSVIVTFDPHPQIVLKNKDKDIKILSTTDEKIKIFESYGIDLVYVINFTKEFSQTPAREFYINYLINGVGVTDLVLGYDHMFGKNREGNFDTLTEMAKEFDFNVDKVEEFTLNGAHISSTEIRNFLLSGEIEKANNLLGREYSIEGEVIHGDKRGKELGYPTANLKVDEFKLIPKNGIYAVSAEVDDVKGNGKHNGMMSIGVNPTVSDNNNLKIEVNIFDFDKDIYGKKIKINFIDYMREEQKFNSLEDLIEAMASDKRKILNKLN
jgi:riboflavin kinase/FMN adenylyltransferase